MVERSKSKHSVKIALWEICELKDAYLSVAEALRHAGKEIPVMLIFYGYIRKMLTKETMRKCSRTVMEF